MMSGSSRCSSASLSVKSTATSPGSSGKSTPSPKRQQLLTPPTTPTRTLYKELATIHVGEQKVEFPVHRDIFTAASPFFRAAWNQQYGFTESTTGSIHLPEVRPDDFQFFEQWIYSKSLAHEEVEAQHPAFFRLIRLYALADQLEVEGLRNAIVDETVRLSEKYNSVPTPNDTQTLDQELREKCGLRDLVVDLFVWKKTDNLVQTHEDSW
jgi:hypothetical protein